MYKQLGLKYIKTPARIVDYAMQKHWLTEYFLQPSLPTQYMYYDSKLLTQYRGSPTSTVSTSTISTSTNLIAIGIELVLVGD